MMSLTPVGMHRGSHFPSGRGLSSMRDREGGHMEGSES